MHRLWVSVRHIPKDGREEMMRLAIYDMDKTITRKATYSAFLVHAALHHAPWRLLLAPLSAVFGLLYLLKWIDRARLKELNLILFVGRWIDPVVMDEVISSFAEKTVKDNVYRQALVQIARDREDGCRLIMATASYRFYADAIARALGFDIVIATELEEGKNRLRAQIKGGNCYSQNKRRRIEAWFDHEEIVHADLQEVRCYSDHVSDIPMLELADAPIVTNPHPALRVEAIKRGWKVVDWK